MPRFPGFIGASNTPQSVIHDAEETINLYVERSPSQGATSEAALYPAPGFSAWATVSDAKVGRALKLAAGRLFAVIGNALYEFDATGTATKRGTLNQDGNPAQIVYNGTIGGQLGIASGGNIYAYTLATNTLSAALLSGNYTHLAYAGGYGFAFNVATGRTLVGSLNDLSTWDVANFFTRSFFADPAQAIFTDENNLVWTLGSESFEVRYNSGTGTQPWVPLSGLVGPWGIAAPFAFGVSPDGNAWLTANALGTGRFVVTRGAVPEPVSTYAFNTTIGSYLRASTISDAEVVMHELDGHTFANVAFPAAQTALPTTPTTWALDLATQSWTKRGRWSNGSWQLWAPRVHCQAFGKHLVGDHTSGTIWWMDPTLATDTDGAGIRRVRRTPHLNGEHRRVPLDQLELLLDAGLGVPSGQGSDPKIMLRISNDGGRTWSPERQASVGRLGEYKRRAYWTRLGASPDAVVEVSFTEPVPLRITDAWVNNAEGMASAGRAA